MSIILKRIYEEKGDVTKGNRILVDRVWPRGISKNAAKLDDWAKDLAPSPSLRKWFNHEPEKFEEFSKQYRSEIQQDHHKLSLLNRLKEKSKTERVILLYGSKNTKFNHAVVLKEMMRK
ncbi:DUF488 domain-containing protein [Halobacillus massiliensis]|uniref:DUF488 domain-containing protein n=1 Tax=Halobacillus massiliensis TaxID=1926286 RepID=UPI0009E587BB|nr:DUF488 family protein [Halobacillus massiliensis]